MGLQISGISLVLIAGFYYCSVNIIYHFSFWETHQAEQRKGRTGRTCDGQVFRMVPKTKFYEFMEFERPAIQLLSLREQVLTISCSESKAINDPKGEGWKPI